jgi:hypothetical protein
MILESGTTTPHFALPSNLPVTNFKSTLGLSDVSLKPCFFAGCDLNDTGIVFRSDIELLLLLSLLLLPVLLSFVSI